MVRLPKPPLATDNLLENTDGVLHQCSLGAPALLPSIYADGRSSDRCRYSQVREKMLDPQYSGWFLKFDPNGAAGLPAGQYYSPRCTKEALGVKCSPFYHDQEQTPSVPRASSNATRTEHGAWYVYNNTNDVSALHPGYRTITNAGPAIDWTACSALADKADRKIFTWWANKVGGNGSCWLSSEWSTPPIPPNQGKLPVIEAEHVSGYKPSSSTDPAPPPLGLYDECDDGECDCGPGLPCGEYVKMPDCLVIGKPFRPLARGKPFLPVAIGKPLLPRICRESARGH